MPSVHANITPSIGCARWLELQATRLRQTRHAPIVCIADIRDSSEAKGRGNGGHCLGEPLA